MSKIRSNTLMSSEKGGEYIIPIMVGNAFISFHLPTGQCMGLFFESSDLTQENFTNTYNHVIKYFNSDTSLVEIKIIGKMSVINRLDVFFQSKKMFNIKKVAKSENVDVMFLPKLNKVRVSNNLPEVIESPKKIRVLIVDDSKTIRNILAKVFRSDPQFEVCGMAEKPSEVEALILSAKPDVITLDIHMPEMDGVTLLKIIAPKYKIPCVMISSISMAEGPLVLEALENGAVDYIQKPEMAELNAVVPVILEKVKTAAQSKKVVDEGFGKKLVVKTQAICNLNSLIVLGASTGGTEAIRVVLTGLPNEIPPILIVQHIPALFSTAFANRMNELCSFEVKEAENGDEVRANRVLIAPGGKQMKMIHKNSRTYVEINEDSPVNRFKPSVDYLFQSVVKNLYCHTVGVLLTGMGRDGARGMVELKNNFALTIAQDEKSCVVFGMPREAINQGGASYVESIEKIAEKICILTNEVSQIRKAKSA